MAKAGVIAFFSAAVFLGNVAFSATGFAMAIVFLFLYQMGSLAWLDCCNIRYAVFIQTIGFVVILPIVLWRANLRQNIRAELLVAFVPITFAGTPLGQYLQDFTPVGALKVVIGSLTIAVAAWQLREYFKNRRNEEMNNNRSEVALDNVFTTMELDERPPVFFMIGSQRSGSNWLHTMIAAESKLIATPHPPHILKCFMPILGKFGDLCQEENLRILVDHVCEFVEKNPVPWVNANDQPIIFDREEILQCCQGSTVPLVAAFEAVMDVFTKRNMRKTWMCKSMSYGKFHQQLYEHFGSRLRYVYLHRDPRDVCLSFFKAPVGDSHYYVIAETWRRLQEVAIDLCNSLPEGIVHQMSYESLLENKKETLEVLFNFLNATVNAEVLSAHTSKEARRRAKQSSLWKNLVRGESILGEQMEKWKRPGGLTDDDAKMIEAQCKGVMGILGYKLEHKHHLPEFSEEEVAEFRRLNEEGKAAKKTALRERDPEDCERRELQASVLEKRVVRVKESEQPENHENEEGKAAKKTAVQEEDPEDHERRVLQASALEKRIVRVKESEEPENNENQTFWNEIKNQLWPIRPVFLWMLLAGFASGFLGGLIGVRGPPLIMFFFFFEYPKNQIKANGSIVATINVVIRVFTYAIRSPPASYPSKNWFTEQDKYLYIFVIIIGVLGAPVGLWLSTRINQARFKLVLACILIINGITMIVTGSLDL